MKCAAQRGKNMMGDLSYNLPNSWDTSGGFKVNMAYLTISAVMDATVAYRGHIFYFLSNKPGWWGRMNLQQNL